jgi:Ca-activated chloride channel homolog
MISLTHSYSERRMNRFIRPLITAALACWACATVFAQKPERAIHQGNEAYKKGDQAAAIKNYSRAASDPRAAFNLGNAFYRQDSVRDAQRTFENATSMAKDPEAQARAYHNLGNAWMKQQNWKEAVNAYKQSLKRNPNDDETRYNLAFAQKKLQQQEQQQNKDDQQKQDQQQQQQQQQQQDQDQQKQDQQQQGQMDKQDMQRMLDAMQQQEKQAQQKAREKMKVAVKKPIEKDW